jgi:hypothetical protein
VALVVWIGLLSGCAFGPFASAGPPSGGATWALPPDADVGPNTQEFVALVTEIACASGQTSEGRILPPEITYDDTSVTVTFFVRQLVGAQACPGNPATPFTVTLGEPLGARELLDGGVRPPRPPPVCGELFCV